MNPGLTNPHGQRILRCTELPSPTSTTTPATPASLSILVCDHCGYVYACPTTDLPHKKCRQCQHGPPGLPVPAERDPLPWTRDDHLLAFTLYNQIPFGAIVHNPLVTSLAALLARSTNSVTTKLANFARFDPVLQTRADLHVAHATTPEEQIWTDFTAQPESLVYESVQLLAQRLGQSLARTADIQDTDLPPPGPEREALLRLRVTQSFFRHRVLSAYEFRCCVTGLRHPDLLIASHIIPWDTDRANRLNPKNSLCLNPLHARAFDRGLMWIDDDFTIRFSPKLRTEPKRPDPTLTWLISYAAKSLQLPKAFKPDPDLLRRHSLPYRPKDQTKRPVAPWGPI